MQNNLNIKIGGRAGEGVKVTGLSLAKIFSRLGFKIFAYQEYPSLIRGGYNSFHVHLSDSTVFSQVKKVDLLLCLSSECFTNEQINLHQKSLVIYDPAVINIGVAKQANLLAVPLKKIATSHGNPLMANSVVVGSLLALLDLPLLVFNKLLQEIFLTKGEPVIRSNQASALDGSNYIKKNYHKQVFRLKLPKKTPSQLVISGNEAVALGAIAAGMKFFTSYPMTPATSILHYLVDKAQEYDYVVHQSEDEISAINEVVGASFAGVRAMTATSGGGFCLMTEGVGLAGMTETPIVVVNAMRPGPSTGMPTYSSQGDLRFVLHCGQDEFLRVVFAPGDAQECFFLTKQAFYLAEKYQIPVIILLDKNLSESYYSCHPFPGLNQNKRFSFTQPNISYLRYKDTVSGISPRPFLGSKNGAHLTNSYEHSEDGLAAEDSQTRSKLVKKRFKKFPVLKKEILAPLSFGQPKGKIGLISWGSNKGAILQALKGLTGTGFLHLHCLWPFPAKSVTDFIRSYQIVYCLEGNSQGQLSSLIREQTGIKIKSILKYDGRPFYPDEIITKLKKSNEF